MFPIMAGNSASTGYNLTRSLRFRRSAGGYLSRTAGAGNQQIMTLSFWFKRGVLGVAQYIFGSYSSGSAFSNLYIESTNQIGFADAASATNLLSTQVFRDPSAWYHIVVAIDTTQATAANRVKFYVNNVQITAFAASTYPAQNTNLNLNNAVNHTLFNNAAPAATNYTDGYLAETNFINAQQLTPSSFGSTNALTGVWQPARYAGTYGTNGFYLPFTDNSALTTSSNVGLGKDFSGNGNYWTTNNISITAGVTYDSMTDVPTLTSATAANFAVLNPLDKNTNLTLSNGNLTAIPANTADYYLGRVTIAFPSSGKYYWELTLNNTPYLYIAGIYSANRPYTADVSSIGNEYQVSWGTWTTYIKYQSNGAAFANWGTNTNPTSGDVLMFAVDVTNGTMWIGRNGTWYNTSGTANPATNTDPRFSSVPSSMFAGVNLPNPASGGVSLNFGQQPFSYTPPTGFVALNTYNLPTSTILQGNKVMDATLWSGTGANQNIVNAGGFKPDLVWGKIRSGADQHFWGDSVRGLSYYLSSNSTGSEITSSVDITSLNSNGFTLGTGTDYNRSGYTFVGWQWQAGQGSTSSNTNGTITSTVSVNASAGFSVVTYTGNGTNGATVGHGLGVKPSLIIEKGRASAYNWVVQGCGVLWPTATQTLFLNSTSGLNAGSGIAAPTSSVFTPAALNYANESGLGYVAYCWTPIAGYSAFGSYTGNGSTDGPFVYTGFRPRWIMMKCTNAASDWYLFDTARDPYNVSQAALYPNLSDAEGTFSTRYFDILSNGFKLRTTANPNTSNTFIYVAFAENPFKNALAR